MADQITKILIRKGTKDEKNSVVLSQAELGYTTDQKRTFVGDGITAGGNVTGNKYLGEVNLDSDIDSLSFAEKGDTVFDTSSSTYLVLSGSNNQLKDNYLRITAERGTVTQINAGAGLIIDTDKSYLTTTGTVNIKLDSTKRNPLSKSSNGLLFDYDVLYPIGSVILTQVDNNPSNIDGILSGSGQQYISAGNITTSSSTILYAWIRTA